jgi:ribA/ribD-fused uncharacterized protein
MISVFRREYAFLSNFAIAPLLYEGYEVPTSEHAYQAAKARTLETRMDIIRCETPADAKAIGQLVPKRADWQDIKVNVMLTVLRLKFHQNADLCRKLVATGDEELVEGNTWGDVFWGVCEGKGLNWLGRLLMQVRSEMKGYTL